MVQRKAFGMDGFKAMRFKQSAHRAERPIRDVLVINGIESALVENIDQVMRLNDKNPIRREGGVQAPNEVLQFGNVRESVSGGDG